MNWWVRNIKECTELNRNKQLLILASTVTGWVSISPFASLVRIPIGVTSSAIELKICAKTAQIIKKKNQ